MHISTDTQAHKHTGRQLLPTSTFLNYKATDVCKEPPLLFWLFPPPSKATLIRDHLKCNKIHVFNMLKKCKHREKKAQKWIMHSLTSSNALLQHLSDKGMKRTSHTAKASTIRLFNCTSLCIFPPQAVFYIQPKNSLILFIKKKKNQKNPLMWFLSCNRQDHSIYSAFGETPCYSICSVTISVSLAQNTECLLL